MKQNKSLIITMVVLVAVTAFAYGALTANSNTETPAKEQTQKTEAQKTEKPKPTQKVEPVDLTKQLAVEEPEILKVINTNYPQIATSYVINKGKLYGDGSWYGTTLTYTGTDTMSRDTLRILMQKQGDDWKLLTTPPQILLSTVEFPDVPKEILKDINQPISLPGSDTAN